MMSKIKIEVLPAVDKVVREAEATLSELVGLPVTVQVKIDNTNISDHESRLILMLCQEYNVSWEKILSKKRNDNVVDARHLYCYVMREVFDKKFMWIASRIQRNHGAVFNSVNRVKNMIYTKDDQMMPVLNKIKKYLSNEIL